VIGEGVVLGAGTAIVAPRVVLADGVEIGAHSIVRCEEVFAAGEIAWTGESLKLTCRRAFIGAGTWIAANVQVGGGGHRDPWATFVIGELGFMGGEAFVNVCRPVVIGREAFLTMRSVLLTHNIGHSVLEGFENRFAGVVLEDRAQIGVGAVVYAGCRIGRESIVVSNSYVVSDVHEGTLAAGVPARPIGKASRAPSRARQVELAKRIVDELEEVLGLSGIETAPLADGLRGFELTGAEGPGRVMFVETFGRDATVAGGAGETVVLTLDAGGDAPSGCAVLDLLGRRVTGEGGVLLDSVREFCRKRGIRFEPGPWRYGKGLV
jgi:acetyltransferase-like isoleucine patch superfamily enzyme